MLTPTRLGWASSTTPSWARRTTDKKIPPVGSLTVGARRTFAFNLGGGGSWEAAMRP